MIAIGMIFSFIRQEWINTILIGLIFLLTYLPTILKKKYRFYLPIEFDLVIISFIFLSLFLGEIHNYYYKFWWWDLWLHGQSGVFAGLFGFILVYIINTQKNIKVHMKPGFIAIFAFTFAITFGTFWEIFEFTMDSTLGTNMQKTGITDTMGDLILLTIGGLFTSTVGYLWMKKKIKTFVFDKSINRFIKQNQHLFED